MTAATTPSILTAVAIVGAVTIVDQTVGQKKPVPAVTVGIGCALVGIGLLALAGPAPALATALAWLIAIGALTANGTVLFKALTRATGGSPDSGVTRI
jgi:hypothetical protein